MKYSPKYAFFLLVAGGADLPRDARELAQPDGRHVRGRARGARAHLPQRAHQAAQARQVGAALLPHTALTHSSLETPSTRAALLLALGPGVRTVRCPLSARSVRR